MNRQIKFFYVVILICFLPAYTQVHDTPKVIIMPDTIAAKKEIANIKRSVLIDLWLVKFRIGKIVRADSIKIIQDSLMIKDTSNDRTN